MSHGTGTEDGGAEPGGPPRTYAGRDRGGDDIRPITVVSTWDVTPGRESAFEAWAHDLTETAARFPGHLGATWLRAEGSRHRYYTVLNYRDEDRLRIWLESPERAERMRRLDGIAEEHRQHDDTTGLETWFSLPGEAVPPPARWKMAIVTLIAVYPLSLFFQGVLGPLTASLPLPLRSLIFPVVVVPALTYAVMPRLSRLLRGWLYPLGRRHPPARRTDPRRPGGDDDRPAARPPDAA